MDLLVRRIVRGTDGSRNASDTALSAKRFTLGSGGDCDIQLIGKDVAALHANLEATEGGLRLEAIGRNRVSIGGKARRQIVLQPADSAKLGPYSLKILNAPAGFDAAVEIDSDIPFDPSDFESAFRTDLRDTWLSARTLSWAFFFVLLFVGIASPFWMVHRHRNHQPSVAGLTDDSFWSSGPLTLAHAHAIGQKCDACHSQMFARVQDKECRQCHRDTHDHVSQQHRAMLAEADSKRCGQCHREHLDEVSQRMVKDDGLCVGCHAEAEHRFASLNLKAVKGFDVEKHPAFDVRLSKLENYEPGGTNYQWVSFRSSLKSASQESNLEFQHVTHLDANKVIWMDSGNPLSCNDCHKLNSGDLFTPITMVSSCATCHQLLFDVSAPDRQLPHGRIKDAMGVIEDYFNRKFTDPQPKPPHELKIPLPDHLLDPGMNFDAETCQGPAVPCAKTRAKSAIEFQFAKDGVGCKMCHTVDATASTDIHEQYHVRPVRLASNFFPDLKFSHKAHNVMGDLTGDAACESCHAARASDSARQVLLPDLDKCLSCHRDRNGSEQAHAVNAQFRGSQARERRLTLQCTSCHEYHPTASLLQARRTERE
jgi:predicted CXXCH cytochrome family protein